MELLQVLHQDIPQRHKIFKMFQKKASHDISKILISMLKNVIKDIKDLKILNAFIIELYDMLYYYVLFDKIKIAKKILRLLEELALPFNYIGEDKRREIAKKIKKIKV